jgi:hypothetical protein
MDLWVWIVLAVVLLGGVAARQVFYRRWVANGLSPTRAAVYSTGVSYLPLVLVLGIASVTGGGPDGLGGWAVMIGVLVL